MVIRHRKNINIQKKGGVTMRKLSDMESATKRAGAWCLFYFKGIGILCKV